MKTVQKTVYKRILMPLDGSPCSEQALGWGLEFARALDAEVAFLYVLENPLSSTYLPGGALYATELMQDLHEAGTAILENAKVRAEAAGVACDAFIRGAGRPAEAILAAESAYHLTLMGTHSRRGLDRLFLGSVTEAVLRRSDKPHLILHCHEENTAVHSPNLEHFLFPIDGSVCSEYATEAGLNLAAALGAGVTFLYALETPFAIYTIPEMTSYQTDIREDLKKAAQTSLGKAQRRAAELGVEADVRLIETPNTRAEEAILTAEKAFDLTVMGTHGRRGLGRALLGSVTEGVLRQSSAPHLIVRCRER